MLSVKVIGTGSSGNCYLVRDENNKVLVLDAGIEMQKVKIALDFDISSIAGVFISHEHVDHAKYRKDFERMGADIFAPYDTQKIRDNRVFGPYTLQAFQLPHGETKSYGALIRHASGETLLYLTDFEYSPYTFRACKVNHYLIECNYQKDLLNLDAPNKEHKIMGHCSLDTCADFLKTNITDYMQNVILIHGGFTSCDVNNCIETIEKVLTPNVVVKWAFSGNTYYLSDNRLPFSESEEL